MKIRPELEVPDGDECGRCTQRYRDICLLFDEWISSKNNMGLSYGSKLPQCRAAEVNPPWCQICGKELHGFYCGVCDNILSVGGE